MYHVREYDVRKLMEVKEPIDVFLSHDWPLRITDYGDWKELVRRKHYFKQEVGFVEIFEVMKLQGFSNNYSVCFECWILICLCFFVKDSATWRKLRTKLGG